MPPAPEAPILAPHGRVLNTDARGFLVPDVDPHHVAGLWREISDRAVATYQDRLGDALHSVYVRGSVPRGLAVEGLSDVDTWAAVHGAGPPGNLVHVPSWAEGVAERLLDGQSQCTELELCVSGVDRVLGDRSAAHARTLLKLSAVCLWGTDLRPGLPEVRPDASARAAVYFLPKALVTARMELAAGEDLDGLALWIGKAILRSSFELVMPDEGTWTRDLYWCWEAWSRHHPETAASLARVASQALAGVSDPEQLTGLLEEPAVRQVEELALGLGAAPWASPD